MAPDKRIVAIGAFQNSSNGCKAIGKMGDGLANHLEARFFVAKKHVAFY